MIFSPLSLPKKTRQARDCLKFEIKKKCNNIFFAFANGSNLKKNLKKLDQGS